MRERTMENARTYDGEFSNVRRRMFERTMENARKYVSLMLKKT